MKWTFALASLIGAGSASASMVSYSSSDRPITKVVKLLEKMAKTSQTDAKKEREIFAKFKCYCDKNNEDKTTAIANGEESIARLQAEIEKLLGASGKLSN